MKTSSFAPAPVAVALACATLLLVVYHLRFLLFASYGTLDQRPLWVSAFYFVSGLGHQAFAVYFAVQGFLLARAAREARSYAGLLRAKAAGTYAMLVPILLLGLLLDGGGSRYLNAAGVYTAYPEYALRSIDLATLAGQLAMLQPFAVPTFGTNGVLFVLAFEWWYSCMYLLLAAQLWRRRWLGLLLLGLLGAAVLASFPSEFITWGAIWLLGVLVAQPRAPAVPAWLALPLFVAALGLSRYLDSHVGLALLGSHLAAFTFARNLLFALGFALLLLALPRRTVPLAPGFAQALFFGHAPLMMFLVALHSHWQPLKQPPHGWSMLWLGAATLAIYGIGWLLFAGVRRCICKVYKARAERAPA
jgi:hypothetical protein